MNWGNSYSKQLKMVFRELFYPSPPFIVKSATNVLQTTAAAFCVDTNSTLILITIIFNLNMTICKWLELNK